MYIMLVFVCVVYHQWAFFTEEGWVETGVNHLAIFVRGVFILWGCFSIVL